MYEGFTYVFDVSDSNLKQSDFKFSTTEGGTRGGGTEYTTDVTTSGTIGNAGATVTIQVPKKTPSPNPVVLLQNYFTMRVILLILVDKSTHLLNGNTNYKSLKQMVR